jgi:hypothetical protein
LYASAQIVPTTVMSSVITLLEGWATCFSGSGTECVTPNYVRSFLVVVSIVLVALPWILRFNRDPGARDLYGAGALIFLIWVITDYPAADQKPGRS